MEGEGEEEEERGTHTHTHTRIQMDGMRVKVEVVCLVDAIESALELQVSPSILNFENSLNRLVYII